MLQIYIDIHITSVNMLQIYADNETNKYVIAVTSIKCKLFMALLA